MIHILCAADKIYGKYAGIMLSSVVRSTSEKLHVHLLSDGVNIADVKKIKNLLAKTGGCFDVYDIRKILDKASYDKFALGHISRAAFGRIIASEIIREDIDYFIYLDCDVIVKSDIKYLWSMKNEVSFIAAVSDPWVEVDVQHKAKIGLSESESYYNSGVLLINSDAWRKTMSKENISQALADYDSVKYADQDLINILFRNRINCLSRSWNTLVTTPDHFEIIDDALYKANIIHYASGIKPWHIFYCRLGGKGQEYFIAAKSRSPWKFSLPDFHLRRAIRKIRRLLKL